MSYPTLKKKTTMILRRHTLQVPAFSISFIFLKLSTSNKIFFTRIHTKTFSIFPKTSFFLHPIFSQNFLTQIFPSPDCLSNFHPIFSLNTTYNFPTLTPTFSNHPTIDFLFPNFLPFTSPFFHSINFFSLNSYCSISVLF